MITIDVIKIVFFLLLPVIVIPQLFSIGFQLNLAAFKGVTLRKSFIYAICAAFAYAAWKGFIGGAILYK